MLNVFSICPNLTSVTMGNSVTSIGDYAFSNCLNLTSVTIPNSVISIGDGAFYDCGLTSVTMGNSVTSIGHEAFYGCIGLTSITIPNSVTSIGDGAFAYCIGLTSITIPNSVTSIGDGAFECCFGLTSVTIPNSMTSIGNFVFYNSGSDLFIVTCLNPIPPILGVHAFSNISRKATLYVPDVEAYKASDWAQCFSTIEQIDPNAIRGIEAGKKNIPTTIHDLGGRRVTEPVKGRIYIVDGKTVVW